MLKLISSKLFELICFAPLRSSNWPKTIIMFRFLPGSSGPILYLQRCISNWESAEVTRPQDASAKVVIKKKKIRGYAEDRTVGQGLSVSTVSTLRATSSYQERVEAKATSALAYEVEA